MKPQLDWSAPLDLNGLQSKLVRPALEAIELLVERWDLVCHCGCGDSRVDRLFESERPHVGPRFEGCLSTVAHRRSIGRERNRKPAEANIAADEPHAARFPPRCGVRAFRRRQSQISFQSRSIRATSALSRSGILPLAVGNLFAAQCFQGLMGVLR